MRPHPIAAAHEHVFRENKPRRRAEPSRGWRRRAALARARRRVPRRVSGRRHSPAGRLRDHRRCLDRPAPNASARPTLLGDGDPLADPPLRAAFLPRQLNSMAGLPRPSQLGARASYARASSCCSACSRSQAVAATGATMSRRPWEAPASLAPVAGARNGAGVGGVAGTSVRFAGRAGARQVPSAGSSAAGARSGGRCRWQQVGERWRRQLRTWRGGRRTMQVALRLLRRRTTRSTVEPDR